MEELSLQENTETKPKVTEQSTRIKKQLSISEDRPVQDDKGKTGNKEKQLSPAGLPRPVSFPLNLSQRASDETQNAHIQRYNRTTRMKEKLEKWKERSSEAALAENVSSEILRLQSQRKLGLR